MKNHSDDNVKLCEFCRYAAPIAISGDMLCEKRGVVGKEYSCRKFLYDPLKRVPRRPGEVIMPTELSEEL